MADHGSSDLSQMTDVGTAAVLKVKKEELKNEEEEDMEIGEDEEMMEWALSTLKRTQYLSESSSKEEEPTCALSKHDPSPSAGQSSPTQLLEPSISDHGSGSVVQGEQAATADTPDHKALKTEPCETEVYFPQMTPEDPSVDPLAVDPLAVPVKEESPTSSTVKKEEINEDGTAELITPDPLPVPECPKAEVEPVLPACLQQQCVKTEPYTEEQDFHQMAVTRDLCELGGETNEVQQEFSELQQPISFMSRVLQSNHLSAAVVHGTFSERVELSTLQAFAPQEPLSRKENAQKDVPFVDLADDSDDEEAMDVDWEDHHSCTEEHLNGQHLTFDAAAVHSETGSRQCSILPSPVVELDNNKNKNSTSQVHQWMCNICEKSFTISSDLDKHRMTHIKDGMWMCCFCEKAFTDLRGLIYHRKTHCRQGKSSVMLGSAAQESSSYTSVSGNVGPVENISSATRQITASPKDIGPPVFDLGNNDTLVYHKLKCNECDKYLKLCSELEEDLKKHLRSQPNSRKLLSTFCDKNFSNLCQLASHMKTHFRRKENSVKNVEAQGLSSNIPLSASAVLVENISSAKSVISVSSQNIASVVDASEQNKWVCIVCDETFGIRHDMEKHQKTHFKRGAWLCCFCDRPFSHLYGLMNHKRTCRRHEKRTVVLKAVAQASSSIAPSCGSVTPASSEHFPPPLIELDSDENENNATELQKCICSICDKKFRNLCDLLTHRKTHFRDGKWRCNFCDRPFSHLHVLISHIETRHGYEERSAELKAVGSSSNVPNATPASSKDIPPPLIELDSDKNENNAVENQKWMCNVCDTNFPMFSDFVQHRLTHKKDGMWVCFVCDKPYKTARGLIKHKNIHYKQRRSSVGQAQESSSSFLLPTNDRNILPEGTGIESCNNDSNGAANERGVKQYNFRTRSQHVNLYISTPSDDDDEEKDGKNGDGDADDDSDYTMDHDNDDEKDDDDGETEGSESMTKCEAVGDTSSDDASQNESGKSRPKNQKPKIIQKVHSHHKNGGVSSAALFNHQGGEIQCMTLLQQMLSYTNSTQNPSNVRLSSSSGMPVQLPASQQTPNVVMLTSKNSSPYPSTATGGSSAGMPVQLPATQQNGNMFTSDNSTQNQPTLIVDESAGLAVLLPASQQKPNELTSASGSAVGASFSPQQSVAQRTSNAKSVPQRTFVPVVELEDSSDSDSASPGRVENRVQNERTGSKPAVSATPTTQQSPVPGPSSKSHRMQQPSTKDRGNDMQTATLSNYLGGGTNQLKVDPSFSALLQQMVNCINSTQNASSGSVDGSSGMLVQRPALQQNPNDLINVSGSTTGASFSGEQSAGQRRNNANSITQKTVVPVVDLEDSSDSDSALPTSVESSTEGESTFSRSAVSATPTTQQSSVPGPSSEPPRQQLPSQHSGEDAQNTTLNQGTVIGEKFPFISVPQQNLVPKNSAQNASSEIVDGSSGIPSHPPALQQNPSKPTNECSTPVSASFSAEQAAVQKTVASVVDLPDSSDSDSVPSRSVENSTQNESSDSRTGVCAAATSQHSVDQGRFSLPLSMQQPSTQHSGSVMQTATTLSDQLKVDPSFSALLQQMATCTNSTQSASSLIVCESSGVPVQPPALQQNLSELMRGSCPAVAASLSVRQSAAQRTSNTNSVSQKTVLVVDLEDNSDSESALPRRVENRPQVELMSASLSALSDFVSTHQPLAQRTSNAKSVPQRTVLSVVELADSGDSDSALPGNIENRAQNEGWENPVHTGKLKCFKCKEVITTVEEAMEHVRKHFTLSDEVDENLCPICDDPLGLWNVTEHVLLHWPHKCKDCGRRYMSPRALSSHVRKCYKEVRGCPLCPKKVKDPKNLPEHLLTVMQSTCPICCECIAKPIQLKIHFLRHFQVRTVRCEICGADFLTKYDLNGHMGSCHGENRFRCKRCYQDLPSMKGLMNHHKTCKKESSKERFKCDKCKKTFKDKWTLRLHIISVCFKSSSKNFHCNQCNKWFAEAELLKRHESLIHQKGHKQCEICGKTVVQLAAHMLIHTSEKNFICEKCGESFLRRTHLENHMRKHTGERPYKCQQCEDRFKTIGHLINHRETHKPVGERRRVIRRNRPITYARKIKD